MKFKIGDKVTDKYIPLPSQYYGIISKRHYGVIENIMECFPVPDDQKFSYYIYNIRLDTGDAWTELEWNLKLDTQYYREEKLNQLGI